MTKEEFLKECLKDRDELVLHLLNQNENLVKEIRRREIVPSDPRLFLHVTENWRWRSEKDRDGNTHWVMKPSYLPGYQDEEWRISPTLACDEIAFSHNHSPVLMAELENPTEVFSSLTAIKNVVWLADFKLDKGLQR